MKIGVLSDTHDQLSNTLFVLETCREQGIKMLIHCGDLTSLEMVSYFEGFEVIYATGNMDYATGAIKKRFQALGEGNFVGTVYRGKLDGVSIAVTHSHIDSKVSDLLNQQHYQWIFHGHTHQRRDEVIRGTRVVNPGALGGLGRESRSFCIVDLAEDQVDFIKV